MLHLLDKTVYTEAISDTIFEYISDLDNKIVVFDLFLDIWILKLFHDLKRKINYIEYEYVKSNNIILYDYNNICVFIDIIIILI